MTDPQLKPCPFCGHEIYGVIAGIDGSFSLWHDDRLAACPVFGRKISEGFDAERLIENWNTRAAHDD